MVGFLEHVTEDGHGPQSGPRLRRRIRPNWHAFREGMVAIETPPEQPKLPVEGFMLDRVGKLLAGFPNGLILSLEDVSNLAWLDVFRWARKIGRLQRHSTREVRPPSLHLLAPN
jgi:hypothetical protein